MLSGLHGSPRQDRSESRSNQQGENQSTLCRHRKGCFRHGRSKPDRLRQIINRRWPLNFSRSPKFADGIITGVGVSLTGHGSRRERRYRGQRWRLSESNSGDHRKGNRRRKVRCVHVTLRRQFSAVRRYGTCLGSSSGPETTQEPSPRRRSSPIPSTDASDPSATSPRRVTVKTSFK